MNAKKTTQKELSGITTTLPNIMVGAISEKITPSAANTRAKQTVDALRAIPAVESSAVAMREREVNRRRASKKLRGVFEKVPGSGTRWIQYFANGRRHREKAGTRGNAINLLTKRKNAVLVGEKLPEKLRARAVSFQRIADAALEYSREEKHSYQHDEYRMRPLVEHFGDRHAENILPEEFEDWLSEREEEREWSVATKNRYIALLKVDVPTRGEEP